MQLQFVGSGDAFGSGGRFNTCFHVRGARASFLIDCGASSLIAMKQLGIAPNAIRAILLTHFHADHCGGLPFFILDAQLFSKRTAPLLLAGPQGLAERLRLMMETSFPGSSRTRQRFPLVVEELVPGKPAQIDGLRVTGYEVEHGAPGGTCLALRIEAEGRCIAYTGDTEWTPAVVDAGRGADLLIAECYFSDKPVRYHLDLASLEPHLAEIGARRVVLTHMSEEMLARRGEIGYETAEDGLVVEI